MPSLITTKTSEPQVVREHLCSVDANPSLPGNMCYVDSYQGFADAKFPQNIAIGTETGVLDDASLVHCQTALDRIGLSRFSITTSLDRLSPDTILKELHEHHQNGSVLEVNDLDALFLIASDLMEMAAVMPHVLQKRPENTNLEIGIFRDTEDSKVAPAFLLHDHDETVMAKALRLLGPLVPAEDQCKRAQRYPWRDYSSVAEVWLTPTNRPALLMGSDHPSFDNLSYRYGGIHGSPSACLLDSTFYHRDRERIFSWVVEERS